MEFTFLADFSILEASFNGGMDIQSNWVTLKFDIFQEALFFTWASSTNLLLEAVQVGAGNYLLTH